jgi:hypothetical protein
MASTRGNKSRSAQTTTDHQTIRRWVDERGGRPARVKGTEGRNDPGLLRVDYPGFSGEDSLEEISWDEWFDGFDQHKLAFLHEDEKDSRFSKLISREGEDSGKAHHGR